MSKLDVIFAGSAGQGVFTAVKVFTRAAAMSGLDTHYTGHSGISQLEGPVIAHARIGDPAGPSPKIRRGTADLIVALDRLEAIRVRPYLAPGERALVAHTAMLPLEARTNGGRYPSMEEVEAAYESERVIWIPADQIAGKLGAPTLASAVMLGALAAATSVVERSHLLACLIGELPSLANLETEAFSHGYRHLAKTNG
jgi:indolepyruvate ferredoxin oxidoreductase beta subunit